MTPVTQRERGAAEWAKFEAERAEQARIEAERIASERASVEAERPRIELEQPRIEPKPVAIEQTENRPMSAAEYIAAEKARRAKANAEREREIDRRIAAEQAERARKATEYIAAEKARRAGQAPVEQPQPEIKPAASEPVKTFQPASWDAAVAKAREIEERAMRKMQEKAEAEQAAEKNKPVEIRRSPELDAEITEWIREEIETPPITYAISSSFSFPCEVVRFSPTASLSKTFDAETVCPRRNGECGFRAIKILCFCWCVLGESLIIK